MAASDNQAEDKGYVQKGLQMLQITCIIFDIAFALNGAINSVFFRWIMNELQMNHPKHQIWIYMLDFYAS